jgi:hypothetical protein
MEDINHKIGIKTKQKPPPIQSPSLCDPLATLVKRLVLRLWSRKSKVLRSLKLPPLSLRPSRSRVIDKRFHKPMLRRSHAAADKLVIRRGVARGPRTRGLGVGRDSLSRLMSPKNSTLRALRCKA